MSDVVLVVPPSPYERRLAFLAAHYPISLGYLASALEQAGVSVEIWDYGVEPYVPQEVFRDRVAKADPVMIGFSCKSLEIRIASRLAIHAKKACPGIVTVVGGPHASALPHGTLKNFPELDVACVGESEETIVELYKRLSSKKSLEGLRGIAWRRGSQIVEELPAPVQTNLDRISFPARNLIDMRLYRTWQCAGGIPQSNVRGAELMVSRGCPFQCIFCANASRKPRFRSIDNITEEVEKLVQDYGINHIAIEDDTFTLNERLVEGLCQLFERLGLTWHCTTRVDKVTLPMLQIMSACGCKNILFGIESGSQRILNLVKKNITVPQIRDAVNWAKRARIDYIVGSFVVGGHPSETDDDFQSTIRLVDELPLTLISVSYVVPYPGSELYELMIEKELLIEEDWNRFIEFGQVPTWRTYNWSPEELVAKQNQLLRRFYLNPRRLAKIASNIRSLSEVHYWFAAFRDFIKTFVSGQVQASNQWMNYT